MRYYSSTTPEKKLNVAVTNTASQITLKDDANPTEPLKGLPTSYPYTLVLDPDTSKEEIVLVTGLSSGSTFNVVRGSDTYQGVAGGNGTSKQSHDGGAVVKHMVTARDLQEPQDHIAASTNVHGLASGAAVVGTTSSQTLTNKTISGSSNTISNIAQSSVTNLTNDLAAKAPLAAPTFTGTVVLPSTTSIGNVSSTELGYLDGVTSAVQTQLDAKSPSASPTFTGTVVLPSTTTINGYNVVAKPIGYFTRTTTLNSNGVVTFDTELIDTINAHSTSANTERYTPNVAGYYRATFTGYAILSSSSGTAQSLSVFVRKNDGSGTGASVPLSVTNAAASTVTVNVPFSVTTILNLNGSTDYINCRLLNLGGLTVSSPEFIVEWIGA